MRGKDLLRELQRTVDELAVLNEIGKALTASLDIGEVMHVILAKVSELLKPRNWSLLLHDPATGELYFHAAVGAGSDKLLGLRIKPGEGIAGWVAQHNKPLLVNDVHADPRFASRFDGASRFHTQSILCVPLAFKDRTLGVIELVNGQGDGGFSEEDLKILGTVAEFSAIAIENARNFHKVQELTVLDDHTGLFNSRHLRRQLDQEVVRATRFGHPVSLIFFDLDHFKRVNDTHGHAMGDEVLKRAVAVCQQQLRPTDVFGRLGGEEFGILLHECSRHQGMEIANRVRAAIAEMPIRGDDCVIAVSASVGLASTDTSGYELQRLCKEADAALYRAKRAGRNCVMGDIEIDGALARA